MYVTPVTFTCQCMIVFGLMLTSLLASPLQNTSIHKHRRHLNRRLMANQPFGYTNNADSTDTPMERAFVQRKDVRDISLMRNKMRSLNLLNPNLLLLPEKSAQFKNGDARFYRINALASKQGRLRSTLFNENSMGGTMKKILLRMN